VALSSRELLLILRARDEASRVVRSFAGEFAAVDAAAQKAARNQIAAGSAMVSVGVGIAGAGAATLAWMKGATDAAVEFNRQVAYTATQVDGVTASQKQLADVVKRTGRDIGVPLDQLNAGLYDIFSSMEVNLPQSEMLLRSFAKEAVAGQVELKEASRATIGILNAFHLKVEDVTRVQDVQFQLVRKGVGTYEEFARVMGRATPSAARAGQSVEVLSGMLAYLTRNGMSAAMASASAARAFDAFAHPKTVARLEEMGVKVKDNEGNFRKFTDVVTDLQAAMKDMTAPERAAALQNLFKGSGGTIQARRFYDAVLKDQESVQQFVGLVGDMENAQGAFEAAYTTMANTTAQKSQTMKTRWELLRIEVGQALIPVLEKLIDWLSTGLKWWNSLDEGLRKQIITWVAIGSAIAVAVGVIVVMSGGFLMLAGAAAMAGISVFALLGIFAGVIAGIAAVIAIVILLAKNWDKVTKAMGAVWQWLWGVLKPIIDWIWDVIGAKLGALWKRVSADVINATRAVGDWVKRIWDMILGWTEDVWPGVKAIIEPIIDWFIGVWPFLKNAIAAVLRWVVDTFDAVWTVVVGILKGAWLAISGVIEGIVKVIMGLVDFIVAIFTLDWKRAWIAIGEIFDGIWTAIKGVVLGVWEAIKGIVMGAIQFIGSTISNGFTAVWNVIRTILDAIGRLWNQFWGWVGQLISDIWAGIKRGTDGFFSGLKSAFQGAVDAIKTIWGGIQDVLATPVNFVIGIIYTKGIKWLWDKVADLVGLGKMPEVKQLAAGAHFANGGPVRGPGGPRDDMINAWLSNGEYVVNARDTARNRTVLEHINNGGAAIPAFADGGVVGKVIDWVGDVGKDVVAALSDPIGFAVKKIGKATQVVKDIAKIPVNLIKETGEHLWEWIGKVPPDAPIFRMMPDTGPSDTRPQMVTKMQGWARQQAGKRYLWGAVGPDNYDCSGLVGNLWAMVMGKPLYRRYMTTATMGAGKFNMMPGPGVFTIYLGPGHTAANIGGLHVEAYGGNGTPLAIGKPGTPLSYYNKTLNMFADGGLVTMKHNAAERFQSWLQHGWPEPSVYDTGGWLRPGWNFNGLRRPEPVLSPEQYDTLLRLADGRSGGDTYQTINITTQEIDPRRHAAELGWEIAHGRAV
jgi:TP901 family phage tail tape measure protein